MPLLPTIEEEDNLSWVRLMWRYRLQFQAMASASMVFVAGGMKLAWAVFESPSGKFLSNASTHQLTISWFVGVIVGAIAAATFVQRVTKNVAHCTSGALLLFGGILFITFPTHLAALICSCLCEGCAYGLTEVQALVTGAEVSHKDIRGLVLSCERTFLWLGVCLQLFYTHLWFAFQPASGYAMHIDQFHGIAVACLGLGAILLALIHRVESPLLLQFQQREMAAMYALKRLHGVHDPSSEMMRMREDYKQLLVIDAGQTAWSVFWLRNARPLLKVVVVRGFAVLSLSLPFNRAFLAVSWNGFGCDMNCIYALAICGLLGSIAGGLLIDEYGRRKLSVMSLLLAGIFIFVVGGIFMHLRNPVHVISTLDLDIIACLMMLYQIVTSAGIAVASTVYTAEAFTVAVKAKCIATVVVCEHLLHIALAIIAFHVAYSNSGFFFSMGSLCLLLGLLVFFFMPETKYLTLGECLVKFKKVP